MVDKKTLLVIVGLVVLVLAYASLFTVNQRERALLFRLGEVVRTDFKPGLYVMVPILNNVRKFDARIQTLDAEPEEYLTVEKKSVLVDSFVKWRIVDVARYYRATGGDQARAGGNLFQIIKKGLRDEFAKRTLQSVVSGDRAEIIDSVKAEAREQAKEFGIEVVDVRLRRVDLPKEVSGSVYDRMRTERARAARDFRARGAEAAERIKADADRQRTVIVAEAYREAERVRGEGDARAADIYAQAFGSNAEFYSLYRSLNAYKNIFRDKNDMLVLDPGSEFFKYFKSPEAVTKP